MNKNFTKNQKKSVFNKREINKEILSPSKKTIDFILSYSKSTKSILVRSITNGSSLPKLLETKVLNCFSENASSCPLKVKTIILTLQRKLLNTL